MSAPLIIQVIKVDEKVETPIVCVYDHHGLYDIEGLKGFLSMHMVSNGYPSWINCPIFNGAKNGACRIVNYIEEMGYIFPIDEWDSYHEFHVGVKIYINEDNGKIYWQPTWTKNQRKVWLKNPLKDEFPRPEMNKAKKDLVG